MAQLLEWFTAKSVPLETLRKGCCMCSDCNGPSATAECFYDEHIQRSKIEGFPWSKPGTKPKTPADTPEHRSRASSFTVPGSYPRSGSFSAQQSRSRGGSFSQFESDPEYFSAGGFGSESDATIAVVRRIGTSTPPLTLGTTPPSCKENGSKKKKKKKRQSSTSSDTIVIAASAVDTADDIDAIKADFEKKNRMLRHQMESLGRSLQKTEAERDQLFHELHMSRSYMGALADREAARSAPNNDNMEFAQELSSLKDYVKASRREYSDYVSGQLLRKPFIECPEEWHGVGSPYLFYLGTVAHTTIPQLVNFLAQSQLAPRMLLVGACAWNCYTSMSLESEDIDFVVEGSSTEELKIAAEMAVAAAVACPEVRYSLDILDAVSRASRRWSGVSHGETTSNSGQIAEIADIVHSIKHRDEKSMEGFVDNGRYASFLRVIPNQHGWRVQLAHRTLLDLCPAETSVGNLEMGMHGVLSKVLPTAIHWRYTSPVNPVVRVGHPLLLLEFLKRSLESSNHWRIQKDLPRLRLLAQDALLQSLAATTTKGKSDILFGNPVLLESFHSLLEKYDPIGWTFIKHLIEQNAQLLSITEISLRSTIDTSTRENMGETRKETRAEKKERKAREKARSVKQ